MVSRGAGDPRPPLRQQSAIENACGVQCDHNQVVLAAAQFARYHDRSAGSWPA